MDNPRYRAHCYVTLLKRGSLYDIIFRGEYIQVTPYFLQNLDLINDYLGDPGKGILLKIYEFCLKFNLIILAKLFTHEWAKFRYGIFEEYGYPGKKRFTCGICGTIPWSFYKVYIYISSNLGDSRYPLFYYESYLSSDGIQMNRLKTNFCTDKEINGHQE